MTTFAEFLFDQLPPPPARVLEIGCGPSGGVTPSLVDAGYDTTAIDERAPEGERFRRITLQQPGKITRGWLVVLRLLHGNSRGLE